MRLGVTHESEHPGVLRKVGKLLHAILPLSSLAASKRGNPLAFDARLESFMKNYVRNANREFKLEVSADEDRCTTPMRHLASLNRLKVCAPGEEPTQGHVKCTGTDGK